jgi:protocatechuate 3,4-dioxygenase alpha subunit
MPKQTASQTVGPYFRIGLIYGREQNNLVQEQTAGQRIRITGTVFDGEGQPVPDAMIEIWQPDANGIFNHESDPLYEQADPHFHGAGRAENRNEGAYEFRTIKPGGRDGNAPYINVYVFARGMLIHAMTRIYFEDEPTNASDSVLSELDAARQSTLIATRDDDEPATYHFDIHLQGEKETVFFSP